MIDEIGPKSGDKPGSETHVDWKHGKPEKDASDLARGKACTVGFIDPGTGPDSECNKPAVKTCNCGRSFCEDHARVSMPETICSFCAKPE